MPSLAIFAVSGILLISLVGIRHTRIDEGVAISRWLRRADHYTVAWSYTLERGVRRLFRFVCDRVIVRSVSFIMMLILAGVRLLESWLVRFIEIVRGRQRHIAVDGIERSRFAQTLVRPQLDSGEQERLLQ